MATDALRRNLGKALEAATGRGRGAWDKQIGAGFGTPGAQQRIRQYPVSEQERIVGRYQTRDRQRRKPAVRQAIGNVLASGEDALDELLTVALNTPSHSINPARPRALRGGYDSRTGTVRIQFRDGAVYEYFDVPKNVWKNMLRSPSTGRYIDRVLDTFPYTRVDAATGVPIGMFSTNAPELAGYFENPGGKFQADEEVGWAGSTEQPTGRGGWWRR